MKMKFSERLKQLRIEAKLNQSEFGNLFGVSGSAIGMYEQGRRQPDIDLLVKISEYFNVSIDWLVGSSDNRVERIDYTKLDLNLSDYSSESMNFHEELPNDMYIIMRNASKLTPEQLKVIKDLTKHFRDSNEKLSKNKDD